MSGSDGSRRSSSSSGTSQDSGAEENWLDVHDESNRAWIKFFGSEAFTSLPIADYIMSATKTKYKDYLQNPKDLKNKVDMQSLQTNPDLDILYKGPGRCATFAVKVCKDLEDRYGSTKYDFRYFSTGNHRIARCEKSKVVIDSSSKKGAFQLKNDNTWMWWKYRAQKWHYNPTKRIMQYQKTKGGSVAKSGEITWQAAVSESAFQMATLKKPALATLFRDVKNFTYLQRPGISTLFRNPNKPAYKAMLRWDVKEKRLECWKWIGEGSGKDCLVISWGTESEGSEETFMQAATKVEQFVARYGIFDQWAHKSETQPKSLHDINSEIWMAATELWGLPTWQENVDLGSKK